MLHQCPVQCSYDTVFLVWLFDKRKVPSLWLFKNLCFQSWLYKLKMLLQENFAWHDVHRTTWQVFMSFRSWNAMFLHTCGQMTHCFINVNTIYKITQTLELVNYIGHHDTSSKSNYWLYFKSTKHNPNIYSKVFVENFFDFLAEFRWWKSQVWYK